MTKTVGLFFSLFLFATSIFSTQASDFYPSALLQLDDYFSHHTFVAEKSTHKFYVFKNTDGFPKLIKTYQMATGKKSGDKFFQGDHRTPEGIYKMTQFLTHKDLIARHGKEGEIYGVGAFVLNYPNPVDSRTGKTGGGIWIHSTNDETRIEKGLDSRGCIVTANKHLIELSNFIELNKTPIVVVHNLSFLSKESWSQEKQQLSDTISDWIDAWQNEDIEKYLSFYHKKKFFDRNRGGFDSFATYKKAVFSMAGAPKVKAENIHILKTDKYAIVSFLQHYESNTINDLGKKTLYLKKDEFYNYKIVSEKWTKNGIEDLSVSDKFAFKPSMRFFETNDPTKILGSVSSNNEKAN